MDFFLQAIQVVQGKIWRYQDYPRADECKLTRHNQRPAQSVFSFHATLRSAGNCNTMRGKYLSSKTQRKDNPAHESRLNHVGDAKRFQGGYRRRATASMLV